MGAACEELGAGGLMGDDFPFNMSEHAEPHPEKKVTPVTTGGPQEEFISPESVPSEPENNAEKLTENDPLP